MKSCPAQFKAYEYLSGDMKYISFDAWSTENPAVKMSETHTKTE